MLGEQDIYLFREGTHGRLYRAMGCQLGADGATFRVWAPNASRVAVIGAFNGWDAARQSDDAARGRLRHLGGDGRQRRARRPLQVPHRLGAMAATRSTRPIRSRSSREAPPLDRVARVDARLRLGRRAMDGVAARAQRARRADLDLRGAPGLVAARRAATGCRRTASIAQPLADYVRDQGFTHVELMPVTEHPVLRLVGLPDDRLLRADRALRRRRRTSCTSSTCCTGTASA